MRDGAGIDAVETGLPGVGEVLEVDEEGEAFPYFFCHKTEGPVGFAGLAVVERLGAVIVGFQAEFPFIFFFIYKNIV